MDLQIYLEGLLGSLKGLDLADQFLVLEGGWLWWGDGWCGSLCRRLADLADGVLEGFEAVLGGVVDACTLVVAPCPPALLPLLGEALAAFYRSNQRRVDGVAGVWAAFPAAVWCCMVWCCVVVVVLVAVVLVVVVVVVMVVLVLLRVHRLRCPVDRRLATLRNRLPQLPLLMLGRVLRPSVRLTPVPPPHLPLMACSLPHLNPLNKIGMASHALLGERVVHLVTQEGGDRGVSRGGWGGGGWGGS